MRPLIHASRRGLRPVDVRPTSKHGRLALTRLDVFAGCTLEQLRPLFPNTDVLRMRAGSVLVRQGEEAQQVLGIVAGTVTRWAQDGTSVDLGPGCEIGAQELLGGVPHSTTSVATTDVTLFVVYGPAFRWAAAALPLGFDRPRSSEIPAAPLQDLEPAQRSMFMSV